MLDVQASARFVFKPNSQARRSIPQMTSGDQQADEAARLEAALLRIQSAHARGRLSRPGPSTPASPDATQELSARLDALIAELRALLAPQG